MRAITKGNAPTDFKRWAKGHRGAVYADLAEKLRRGIRAQLVQEQLGLCAYCCAAIDAASASSHIDHVEPRDSASDRQLDYGNMVASCQADRQCGKAKENRRLPLTPLMPRCEADLRFGIDGTIAGLTQEARDTVALLRLDNTRLAAMRRKAIEAFLWDSLGNPAKLSFSGEDELKTLLAIAQSPTAGRLEAFSPVVVAVIRGLL